MRLPGTRYQEHGWEQVRKLLGQCSLQVFSSSAGELHPRLLLAASRSAQAMEELLDTYVDEAGKLLRAAARQRQGEASGNSYGESVAELALSLAWELRAQPSYWQAFVGACVREHARSGEFWVRTGHEGVLRKKINDMYAGLRDQVDADNYQVALGRPCSANKIYTYRMLDTAYGDIAELFAAWRQHRAQVEAILGKPLADGAIETRQMQSILGCQPEWVIRWSETLERFSGAPGPLHTRSKRFASLKNNPGKIGAMMAEIGEYEALSANRDSAADWRADAGEALHWLDDYWRVLDESAAEYQDGDDLMANAPEDRILPALADEFAQEGGPELPEADLLRQDGDSRGGSEAAAAPDQAARALAVSLPPRFVELAGAAQQAGSLVLRLLDRETLAIRLAVYQNILGPADDSYPAEWCDPATGELPTLQQLAGLDGISMPTLRKRRNEAIGRLQAAVQAGSRGRDEQRAEEGK
jgi:hypothetical protein